MGLGTTKGDFEALSEWEYEDWLWASDEEEVQGEGVIEITDDEDEVEDASGLVVGSDQPGMGGRI
ncbi:hypothetical protein DCAR_0934934 [Daucus carota subsp. sativus]|uniref:Uncharacterized protein n=1 Tax=Daucus carota subsp. sativus TaxID=79200 RepID=A0A175YG40_DAUCS|nr:hypothetical protein DCAR_0934934 [Daucus carota subsp. sativus]